MFARLGGFAYRYDALGRLASDGGTAYAYDAATSRWLSKDPIGLSGGLNLYAFCGNTVLKAPIRGKFCQRLIEK